MIPPDPLCDAGIRERVDAALASFLAAKREELRGWDENLTDLADTSSRLVESGKRVRPAFCWWGWRGFGGEDTDDAIRAAASLDLLHLAALIHDDLIDDSDERRGRPSAHRSFAETHRARAWHRSAAGFGAAAATLTGDICFAWADELYTSSGLDARSLAGGQPILNRMRSEVTAGQYLDLLAAAEGDGTVARALAVARLKTARYTIERPLQLGAAIAGARPEALGALAAYGVPLGEAFQLRDDILGVFGDPAVTGKPAGDDLREGKQTILIALARTGANAGQRRLLQDRVGDPRLSASDADELRDVIVTTGALSQAQRLISKRVEEAVTAASELTRFGFAESTAELLARAAVATAVRTS